jgi:hypothetical protein
LLLAAAEVCSFVLVQFTGSLRVVGAGDLDEGGHFAAAVGVFDDVVPHVDGGAPELDVDVAQAGVVDGAAGVVFGGVEVGEKVSQVGEGLVPSHGLVLLVPCPNESTGRCKLPRNVAASLRRCACTGSGWRGVYSVPQLVQKVVDLDPLGARVGNPAL